MRTNELPLSLMNRTNVCRLASLLLLTALAALPVAAHGQQASAAPAAKPAATAHKTAAHKKSAAKKNKTAAKAAEPVAATAKPAAPQQAPKPDWPVNDPAKPATVSWNAGGLKIEAQNSSLKKILEDVETVTGTSIDGLQKDERVFGTFGPGPAREVLAKLLEGTSYNILMVGELGGGNPRQVELTTRGAKGSAPAGAGNANGNPDDDDVDAEPDEQQQPGGRNGQGRPNNGGPGGQGGPNGGQPPMQGQMPPPGQNSPQ